VVYFLYQAWRSCRKKEKVIRLAEQLIPDWEHLKRLRRKREIFPLSIRLAYVDAPELMQLALERGIDPTDPSEMEDGDSALSVALMKRNVDVAKLLIAAKGIFGEPRSIIKGVAKTKDLEVLQAVFAHFERTPWRDKLIRAVLGSDWIDGIRYLLDRLDVEARADAYFLWIARGKIGGKLEFVLKLAEMASREARLKVYESLLKNRRLAEDKRPLLWALGATLGKGEWALEGLKGL